MISGIVDNNGRNPAREEARPIPEVKPEDRLPIRDQLRQVTQENAGTIRFRSAFLKIRVIARLSSFLFFRVNTGKDHGSDYGVDRVRHQL